MSTIIVSDISKTALSANAGLKLREKILEEFEKGEGTVTLDFTDISVFATMFFNACFGYFVKEYRNFEIVDERIIRKNLNVLGESTLRHSLENAKTVLDNEKAIQESIDMNIEDC